jgi:hypothetical protein
MLAFEDREEDDILSLGDIDLLENEDVMVGGTYLSIDTDFDSLHGKIKNKKGHKFTVGFNENKKLIDLSTIIYVLSQKNKKYVANDNPQLSSIHTHAIIDMINRQSTKIELLSYHSLKGFIFKVSMEANATTFFKDIKTQNKKEIGIDCFLLKVVLLSNRVESYTIDDDGKKIRKETETYQNFVNEAKIQQDVYISTLNKLNQPITPSVISFFHMSEDASVDFLSMLRKVETSEQKKSRAIKIANGVKIIKRSNNYTAGRLIVDFLKKSDMDNDIFTIMKDNINDWNTTYMKIIKIYKKYLDGKSKTDDEIDYLNFINSNLIGKNKFNTMIDHNKLDLILKYLSEKIKSKKYHLGVLAMEYAKDYNTYANDSEDKYKPSIFSNMLIMALKNKVIHCDLHKSNIMVKKDSTYFIDFGRIYMCDKINNIIQDCITSIHSYNDTKNSIIKTEKGITNIDIDINSVKPPRRGNTARVNENTLKEKRNTFNETLTSLKQLQEVKKTSCISLLKRILCEIINYEFAYNKQHFGLELCQTRHLFKESSFEKIISEVNGNNDFFIPIFEKIVLFFYNEFLSERPATLDRLLTIDATNTNLYLVTAKSTYDEADNIISQNPIIDKNDDEIEDTKKIISRFEKPSESTIMIETMNNHLFEYEENMCVLCEYREDKKTYWQIHVVYEIYQGIEPEIKLYTLSETILELSSGIEGSLLSTNELPTISISLHRKYEDVFEIQLKNSDKIQITNILPLSICIPCKISISIEIEYEGVNEKKEYKLSNIEGQSFRLRDIIEDEHIINSDETVTATLQNKEISIHKKTVEKDKEDDDDDDDDDDESKNEKKTILFYLEGQTYEVVYNYGKFKNYDNKNVTFMNQAFKKNPDWFKISGEFTEKYSAFIKGLKQWTETNDSNWISEKIKELYNGAIDQSIPENIKGITE